MTNDYGLELTNNSKASWAFSIPRKNTCVMATDICRQLCYGNGIRYQSKAQKAKRQRNFRTIELLLAKGGAKLLAQNLLALIDQVRPADWLAASITGEDTKTPWTLRIHDVGDFYSVPYVEAWRLAAEQRPLCSLWFYTRSFLDQVLFESLTQLASLANCQGWLSLDSENYAPGLLAYVKKPGVWKLALLQEEPEQLNEDLLSELMAVSRSKETVLFPYHRSGHHVTPVQQPGLLTCPAVTGVHKLEPNARKLRPCQACSFCLP
jgi:Gene product 88